MMHHPEIGVARRDFIHKHQQRRPPTARFDHGDGIALYAVGHDEAAVRHRVIDINRMNITAVLHGCAHEAAHRARRTTPKVLFPICHIQTQQF